MAVNSRAVSVGTTATRLDNSGNNAQSLAVYNAGSATVYVGGSDVTTANGIPVAATSWGPGMDLKPGDALYGIVASGTHEVRVIESGVA
jgi:hypothetical protein